MKSVEERVERGEGLYIWSESTGNGKTSWACKILSYYFRKVAFKSGLENEGLYIYLPTFLDDLRQSYDDPDTDFSELLAMLKNCKLLIIDDKDGTYASKAGLSADVTCRGGCSAAEVCP